MSAVHPASRPIGSARGSRGARRLFGLFFLGQLLTAVAFAQAPTAMVDKTECLPFEANGVITAKVSPEVAGTSVRLYFRWQDHADFYYVTMNAKGGGRFWAVLPKAERRNESVERYVAVVTAEGKELARSEMSKIEVKGDCRTLLTEKERGQSENLVIGHTVPAQERRQVLGFLCDGIVSRIDWKGVLRTDDVCRTCVIALWQKRAVYGPVLGVTGIVITDDDPEPSPSRP